MFAEREPAGRRESGLHQALSFIHLQAAEGLPGEGQTGIGSRVRPDTCAARRDVERKSVDAWAREIAELVAAGANRTRELANVIYEAKRKLARGQWTALWRSPGAVFSKRKGEMLAAIGKRLGKLNPQTFAHLPGGWSVLYQLSHLDRATLHHHLHEGRIHPRLTLAEARELVAEFKGQHLNGAAASSKVKRRIQRFAQFLAKSVGQWTDEERQFAESELSAALERIRNVAGERLGKTSFAKGETRTARQCTFENP